MNIAEAKIRSHSGFISPGRLRIVVTASIGAYTSAPTTAPAPAPTPSIAAPSAAPAAAPNAVPQTAASRSRPDRLRMPLSGPLTERQPSSSRCDSVPETLAA